MNIATSANTVFVVRFAYSNPPSATSFISKTLGETPAKKGADL